MISDAAPCCNLWKVLQTAWIGEVPWVLWGLTPWETKIWEGLTTLVGLTKHSYWGYTQEKGTWKPKPFLVDVSPFAMGMCVRFQSLGFWVCINHWISWSACFSPRICCWASKHDCPNLFDVRSNVYHQIWAYFPTQCALASFCREWELHFHTPR